MKQTAPKGPVAVKPFHCCLIVFVIHVAIFAEILQPRRLVDAHTAGVLPKKHYDFECRYYPAGNPEYGTGLIVGIAAGITDRLNIGISYGGEGIIGRKRNVRFNPFPGGQIKYRLFEEDLACPGVTIGYEHQGYGGIADTAYFSYSGYVYKSQGFFLALSKNYLLLNFIQIGFHGSFNYSIEERDKVTWPNAIVGFDMGFNDELAVVLEYDFGFNVKDPKRPDQPNYYGRPQDGFLNAGIRWAFTSNFFLEFDMKDLLEKKQRRDEPVGWSRELKVIYVSHF